MPGIAEIVDSFRIPLKQLHFQFLSSQTCRLDPKTYASLRQSRDRRLSVWCWPWSQNGPVHRPAQAAFQKAQKRHAQFLSFCLLFVPLQALALHRVSRVRRRSVDLFSSFHQPPNLMGKRDGHSWQPKRRAQGGSLF